jgi:hypothetical protein
VLERPADADRPGLDAVGDRAGLELELAGGRDRVELGREAEAVERGQDAGADRLGLRLAAGGGLVRYGPRGGTGGLVQQGWRDAIAPVEHHPEGAGIVRADGTKPAAPLVDADCQAAVVAALDTRARLDPGGGWPDRAAAWEPDVMAIEAGGAVVPGAGSQLGWLLWAGAREGAAAGAAAERLARPDALTGFGLRTLSSAHPAFRLHAYHRGGVSPFDCWLGWGGLRAAGVERAHEQPAAGAPGLLELRAERRRCCICREEAQATRLSR